MARPEAGDATISDSAPSGSARPARRADAPARPGLNRALERNIRALEERRQREEAELAWSARAAETITRFAGTMAFVYLHVGIFGVWLAVNLGWVPWLRPWDPTLATIGMVASVEAIFLTTLILISQNRMAIAAKRRADLDLQISLLAEHEVTKIATLLAAIAGHLGIQAGVDSELREATKAVAPEAVLDEIESAGPRP